LTQSIEILSLILTGLLAGVYLGGALSDARISDLSAQAFTETHQARDVVMRRAMPPFVLATIACVAGSALLAPETRVGRLAVVALLVLDTLVALRLQIPINRRIATWRPGNPPDDWARWRDRWRVGHLVRTMFGLGGFTSLTLLSLWMIMS
jgi:hypothetical protein